MVHHDTDVSGFHVVQAIVVFAEHYSHHFVRQDWLASYLRHCPTSDTPRGHAHSVFFELAKSASTKYFARAHSQSPRFTLV